MVRYRQSLVEERARELNRIQAVLEGANIKLASVVTDINGQSAIAILRAMANGETDAQRLSALAKGSYIILCYGIKCNVIPLYIVNMVI